MKVLARRRLFKQRIFRRLLFGLLAVSVLIGLLIAPIENMEPNAKITSQFDGIYWAVTTITTVGYGDLVPVTMSGKTLSIVLQLIGAIMFGLVIAMIGSYVSRAQDEFYWNRLFERIDQLDQQVSELKKQSSYLVKDKNHTDTPEAGG